MQDRFKYRVWDKSRGEMSYRVCLGFIDDGQGTQDWVCADTTCGQINYRDGKLKDIELMQCTGLRDKNGKLIYEGDVVKTKFYGKCDTKNYSNFADFVNFKVIYKDGKFLFAAENQPYQPLSDVVKYPNYFEIIGNIYENSKLLKVQND